MKKLFLAWMILAPFVRAYRKRNAPERVKPARA